MDIVFVYGALRRGASHHWRMEEGEYLGEGRVAARLFAIDWYPGVVLDGSGARVLGELYLVDAPLMSELDEFEGIGQGGDQGDEYERVRVAVATESGEEEAWIYVYRWSLEGRQEVESGDWIASGLGGEGDR